MFHYYSAAAKRRATKILLLPGGNNSAIVHYLAHWQADIALVLDSENELRRLLPQMLPPHVKVFPLGQGHTARTLAEHASPSIQETINSTAAMNAASGLGQSRAIGYLATSLLLESPQMQGFMDELYDYLLRISGGALDYIELVGKGSVAGGTASKGILLVANAIETAILSRGRAIVETRLDMTGGISYAGLGRRIRPNTAAGVVEAVAHVTSRQQPPRAIRSLRLMELPPVGEDREERNRYMLEVEQAVQCTEVSEIQDRIGPNNSQNGRFGNVSIWRSEHFTPLHPRFHVARDIAPLYAQTLRQLLTESKPQPSLISRLVLRRQERPLPHEDLDSILTRSDTAPPDELLEAIVQPGRRSLAAVDAVLSSGEVLRLSEAHAVWASAPTSVSAAQSRLVLQTTCLRVLDQEIAALESDLAAAEQQRNGLTGACARMIANMQRPGLSTRLGSLFGKPASHLDQLALAARQLRDLADRICEATSDLDALRQARSMVAAERDHLAGRINALVDRLDALVPRAQQQRTDATVVAKPLGAVFLDLLALAPEATEDETSNALIRAVDYVTARGLAEITGATPPRLESVAANIARHHGVMSPPWGGKPRAHDGRVIHVLPPVSPETGDKLTEMLKTHDPDSIVAVAPQMPASLNCTTLFIAAVDNLEDDVFTEYVKSALLDAYNSEHREIFFPTGTAALADLGITIEGGQVHISGKNNRERT